MPLEPYYQDDYATIYHGDCRGILPLITGIHLVVADPPYHGVLNESWDNQWTNDAAYLAWLDGIFALLDSITTNNATLYVFSSPRLVGRVEVQARRHFRVIANVVWEKGTQGGVRNGASGSGIDVTALRTYWPCNTERVVVAEKKVMGYGRADDEAKDASGYFDQCEVIKRSVIGEYLKSEFVRAGVTNKEVAALFPSRTGGLTGCVSNWLMGHNMPTPEQYATMRDFLNRLGGGEYLRHEYEDLRHEYEDLRHEYEDLRRPFFLTPKDQWGDVWKFPLDRMRNHPAQKPFALVAQMIRVSSRQRDLVIDPFMGSGTTLRAAKDLGRKSIGIEIEERYCEIAAKRLSQEVLELHG